MARRGRLSNNEDENLDKKRKLSKQSFKKAQQLFRFTKPYQLYFWVGMFFLVLSTITTLAFPRLAGEITDAAKGKSNWIWNSVNDIAWVFVGILFLQALASFFRVYTFAIVTERTMADIRTKLYNKLTSLPIPFFEKNRVGELVSRINSDISQLEGMLSFGLAELFRQMAVLVIGISILLFRYTELALVMLSTFPVMIIAAILFGRFIRKLSKQIQDKLAQANTIVEETLQAIQIVKAFTNELFEQKRYRGKLNEIVGVALKTSLYRGAFVSFIIFALFGGIILVIWYGANMISAGKIETGELIEFILYTIFIGASVAGMGDLYAQLQKTLGASERILEILDEENEVNPTENQEFIKIYGNIVFQNITFSYPTRPDVQVLKGVDVQLEAGQKIAFVGHSGAGKSTIVQLLMKFYETSTGDILIDNKSINDWDTFALRSNIAIVPQEVMLFGGSIRENILYGNPKATPIEVEEAAKKANAWEFIKGFPEQLETIVGERGIKLSGGQRQRIAIARAILKDPAILILDEATSSLDAESEKYVQEALDELMKNRTTIIIAHRLATIRNVDMIYVISEGKIAEKGSHEQLTLLEDGIYNNLVRLQQMEKS